MAQLFGQVSRTAFEASAAAAAIVFILLIVAGVLPGAGW